VFLIGGQKHRHREGLYQCKPCRRQFSVTVGTQLERLRVPMSTWVRAAHAFSRNDDSKPTLLAIHRQIGVSYRTVLRMRDIIKRAAGKYRGFQYVFGAWPRSFMGHQRQKREETIRGHWGACRVADSACLQAVS
jgi:hypothetical protein